MVLMLKASPAKTALKFVFSFFLNERHHVQRHGHLHPNYALVIDLGHQNINQRERLKRTLAELGMYIAKEPPIYTQITTPFLGLTATLGGVVDPVMIVLILYLRANL